MFTQLFKTNFFILSYNLRYLSCSKIIYSLPNDIQKLVIANRGEIACRIIHTAKKLQIKTVAVFSDADINSLHVALADEAYNIGSSEASESYLNGQKVIDVAKKTKAHAIHPGYGFLSENVKFSDLCKQNDIIFIGPPASAIRDMGIKNKAKQIMEEANVPIVKGYHGDDQSDPLLLEEAHKIGFPVMIKAVSGGGGKGMRISSSVSDFQESLDSARNESKKAFADERVILEKYIQKPRHVEVQVFGDMHDNYVYLFERDCSVQRRHQKIIEEAPAPDLSEKTRKALGEAAVRAARAVKYVGAGTVEFLLTDNEQFYFMEMNTRLQVEHPITEMISGTDLVEWQIKVATGQPLPVTQSDLQVNGHAFEARIYAEDTVDGKFFPCAGRLSHLTTPNPVPNFVRIETGVRTGDEISVFYDPMIAKLVVWDSDRHSALMRLISCLKQYYVTGVPTNIEFLKALASHSEFVKGNVHTGFIEEHYSSLFPPKPSPNHDHLCQVALAHLLSEDRSVSHSTDPFFGLRGFRINHNLTYPLTLMHDEKAYTMDITFASPKSFLIQIDGQTYSTSYKAERKSQDSYEMRISIDGKQCTTNVVFDGNDIVMFSDLDESLNGVRFSPPEAKFTDSQSAASSGSEKTDAVSPMPGVIQTVHVAVGDIVEKNQLLITMVAMKMEYSIRASCVGTVTSLNCKDGDTIAKGVTLINVTDSENDV